MIIYKNIIIALDKLGITNGKEIMLFSKILSLSYDKEKNCYRKDGCIASNEYFSKLLCVTDRNIQKYLKNLKEKGLIKTFEEKDGLHTTTRHIFPQIEFLNSFFDESGEQMDTCLEEGHEHLGKRTRTFESKEVNKKVKSGEQMDTHIIDYNRLYIDYNREGGTPKAPKVADAPEKKSSIIERNLKNKAKYELDSSIIRSWGEFDTGETSYIKKKRIASEHSVDIKYVDDLTKKHKELGLHAKEMWKYEAVHLKDKNGNISIYTVDDIELVGIQGATKEQMKQYVLGAYITYTEKENLDSQEIIDILYSKYNIDLSEELITC